MIARAKTVSPKLLGLLLRASLLVSSGVARAASPDGAVVSPALYELTSDELPSSALLGYRTGAYFYGDDCGGNSAKFAAPARSGLPGGVILSGAAGRELAGILTCDDRRNALTSYRDAFRGKVGQPHAWRNPNGGATGQVMAVHSYQQSGTFCTDFRATAAVSQSISSSKGTACLEQDGNWHTH